MKQARMNFKFHAPVVDLNPLRESLQQTAFNASADDAICFTDGQVVGLYVLFDDDLPSVIEAGRQLGCVENALTSDEQWRGYHMWFSVHEADGTQISTTLSDV